MLRWCSVDTNTTTTNIIIIMMCLGDTNTTTTNNNIIIMMCSGDTNTGRGVHGADTGNDIRATAWCCGWWTYDPPDIMAV